MPSIVDHLDISPGERWYFFYRGNDVLFAVNQPRRNVGQRAGECKCAEEIKATQQPRIVWVLRVHCPGKALPQ